MSERSDLPEQPGPSGDPQFDEMYGMVVKRREAEQAATPPEEPPNFQVPSGTTPEIPGTDRVPNVYSDVGRPRPAREAAEPQGEQLSMNGSKPVVEPKSDVRPATRVYGTKAGFADIGRAPKNELDFKRGEGSFDEDESIETPAGSQTA